MAVLVEVKEYILHPSGGPFKAIVSKVVNMGLYDTKYGQIERLRVEWQTDAINPSSDRVPLSISSFYNARISSKSSLGKLLSKVVNISKMSGPIDVELLLFGTRWILFVEHVEVSGKEYANIISHIFSPNLIVPANVYTDRDEEEEDLPF